MAQSIHGKIEIKPVVGWVTRVRPNATAGIKSSYGSGHPNLFASDITLYDGVAYAKINNPEGKEEYGRLGEKGYVTLEEDGGQVKIVLHETIKHYAIPRLAEADSNAGGLESISISVQFSGHTYAGTLAKIG